MDPTMAVLLRLIVYVLLLGLLLYVAQWALGQFPLPQPVRVAILILIAIVVIVVILGVPGFLL